MSNMRYAHINSQSKVIGVYFLIGEVIRPDYIRSDSAEIGDHYDAEAGLFSQPEVVTLPSYKISNHQITANGQPVTFFAGNYYCEPGQVIEMVGNITDDDGQTVESINIPVTLKMPLIRHANGKPTQDEIYLNVTLQNGVLTATGTIPWSGDWKIIIERNNEAIQRIGANWKLQHEDITFLA